MRTARPAILLTCLVLGASFAAHAVQRSPQATAADNKAMTKTSQTKLVQVPKATPAQAAVSARAAKMLSGPSVLLTTTPRTATEARATMRTLPNGVTMIEAPQSAENQVILVRGADGKFYRSEGELAPQQLQEASQ